MENVKERRFEIAVLNGRSRGCGTNRRALKLEGSFQLDDDVFCQRFESLSVWLHHGDRYMAGLAGLDVGHDPGFAGMDTADDLASSAVPEFA